MDDSTIAIDFKDVGDRNFTFNNIRALSDFLQGEFDYWSSATELIKTDGGRVNRNNIHQFVDSSSVISQVLTNVANLQEGEDRWSSEELTSQIRNFIQQHIPGLARSWLWSGHPFSQTFVDLHLQEGMEAAESFLQVVLSKNIQINTINRFYGAVAGYEFHFQNSDILKRRKGEKISLGHLRNQLVDAKNELFQEIDHLKSDFYKWDSSARFDFSRLYNLSKRLNRRRLQHNQIEFKNKLEEWQNSVSALEATYEEKLKLEKPAEYWAKAAKRYRTQGRWWSAILITVLVFGLLGGGAFFLSWLENEPIGIGLATLQGVVLFGAIAAVYGFFLRVLSKMIFSSFHLMRDAEEREQLTYLYLSLTKDADLDKESRDIVLQALFSRTDTGLLSGDSSPTMPTASDALRALSRVRTQ